MLDPEEFPEIGTLDKSQVCPACWESLQMRNGQIVQKTAQVINGKLCAGFHKDA